MVCLLFCTAILDLLLLGLFLGISVLGWYVSLPLYEYPPHLSLSLYSSFSHAVSNLFSVSLFVHLSVPLLSYMPLSFIGALVLIQRLGGKEERQRDSGDSQREREESKGKGDRERKRERERERVD